jgi:hypothetical protein
VTALNRVDFPMFGIPTIPIEFTVVLAVKKLDAGFFSVEKFL